MSAIRHPKISGFQSRVNEAMDALRTFHFAVNGVEWYDWTPNDAYQTESVVLWFVMRLLGLSPDATEHPLCNRLMSIKSVVAKSPHNGVVWKFINVNEPEKRKERKGLLSSLLKEVETYQASQGHAEIIHINYDSEIKFEKSDENETFELKEKFSNAT
ncbi:hypothetical protein TNCV_2279711 [Trichonephila clavipes]|uniref:Uncharacterized protein n=1 Tax=Trichonephila clavipes TaxID=2585209 RepID=A0A8X6UYQ6_TRICX|nr:hypothetical protein TNCV_2279711 [Trichonephila clavipes]